MISSPNTADEEKTGHQKRVSLEIVELEVEYDGFDTGGHS